MLGKQKGKPSVMLIVGDGEIGHGIFESILAEGARDRFNKVFVAYNDPQKKQLALQREGVTGTLDMFEQGTQGLSNHLLNELSGIDVMCVVPPSSRKQPADESISPHITTPFSPTRGEAHGLSLTRREEQSFDVWLERFMDRLVACAENANVRNVVLVSWLGAGVPPGHRVKRPRMTTFAKLEGYVRSSTVPNKYIVRVSLPIQFLLLLSLPFSSICRYHTLDLPLDDSGVPLTDLRDMSSCIVALLSSCKPELQPEHEDTVLQLIGRSVSGEVLATRLTECIFGDTNPAEHPDPAKRVRFHAGSRNELQRFLEMCAEYFADVKSAPPADEPNHQRYLIEEGDVEIILEQFDMIKNGEAVGLRSDLHSLLDRDGAETPHAKEVDGFLKENCEYLKRTMRSV